MKENYRRYLKMIMTGELFYKLKNKIFLFTVRNKIVKNKILEVKEYDRLKRKYYKIIKGRNPKNKMIASNKVWVFWYQGLTDAPVLIKKCVESIHQYFDDSEVVVLTKNNYEEYVKFPDYIMSKFKKGIISFAHFSDLIRIELLATYGGIWCDATLYFTDKIPSYINNADLFVFKNIDLDRSDENVIVASNWFIVCKANNDLIVATRDLLFEYYKREKFVKNYFFFHLFFTMVTKEFYDMWKNVPTFSNVNPHLMQFELLEEYSEERFKQLKKISFVHKLNKVIKKDCKNKKKTFYDFIIGNNKNLK